MNKIKNIITVCIVAAVLTIGSLAAFAQPYATLGAPGAPVINSASSGNTATGFTNETVLAASRTNYWPVLIHSSSNNVQVVTNMTRIFLLPNSRDLKLQFTAGADDTGGSNVTLALVQTLSGGNPTNSVGANIRFAPFASVVLPLNNTAGPVTVITNFYNANGGTLGDIYAYSITMGQTLIGKVPNLTNYTVWAVSQ